MANRKFEPGMAVMVLTFSFVLAGCPTDGREADTWSDVTAFDQLNGTWKGSSRKTQTMKEYYESNGQTWDPSMASVLGNMKITRTLEMTYAINSTAKTLSFETRQTYAFSGGYIASLWSNIKQQMLSDLDGLEDEGVIVTTDDTKHSITILQIQPEEQISEEYAAGILSAGLQKNQNGTKVKIPAGTLGPEFPQMIMAKQ